MRQTLLTALALLLASPAAAMDMKSDAYLAWIDTLVIGDDWTYATYSYDGMLTYYKRVIVPGAHRRAWLRFESPDKSKSYPYDKSSVALTDIDCVERRMRTVQYIRYADNNMGGGTADSGGAGSWSYVVPGSVGDGILDVVCK